MPDVTVKVLRHLKSGLQIRVSYKQGDLEIADDFMLPDPPDDLWTYVRQNILPGMQAEFTSRAALESRYPVGSELGFVHGTVPTPYLIASGKTQVARGIQETLRFRAINPDGASAISQARFNFIVEGPAALDLAHVAVQYFEVLDGLWHDLPLVDDGTTLSGYFGPQNGFPMPVPYDVEAQFRVMFAVGAPVGDWKITLQLVDLSTSQTKAKLTRVVAVV